MNSLIVLNKNDNVGVSQFIMPEKTKIEGKNIVTKDPIPDAPPVISTTFPFNDG